MPLNFNNFLNVLQLIATYSRNLLLASVDILFPRKYRFIGSSPITSSRAKSTKLLQYEPLKAVLLYLDPNLRFQLSQRLPSIRSVEKTVPLRIQTLRFQKTSCTVNETEYKFSVLKKYPDGRTVETFYRFDKYGLPMYYGLNTVTLGDVDLRMEFQRNRYWDHMEWEQFLKDSIVHCKRRFAHLQAESWLDFCFKWIGYGLVFLLNVVWPKTSVELPMTSGNLQRNIAILEDELALFVARRENSEPPFTLKLQLMIGETRCQVKYDTPLFGSMKRLTTTLFGHRCSIVQVETLIIDSVDKIVRLPVGMKFNVRELSFRNRLVDYDAVREIVDTKTLVTVRLRSYWPKGISFYKIILEAQELYIEQLYMSTESWRQFFKNLTARKVHFDDCGYKGTQMYPDVIKTWMKEGREVGTCYILGIDKEEVKGVLEQLKESEDVLKSSARSISLSMKSGAKLIVEWGPKEKPSHSGDWQLTMRVTSD